MDFILYLLRPLGILNFLAPQLDTYVGDMSRSSRFEGNVSTWTTKGTKWKGNHLGYSSFHPFYFYFYSPCWWVFFSIHDTQLVWDFSLV